jgi:chromosome segregation ATPase
VESESTENKNQLTEIKTDLNVINNDIRDLKFDNDTNKEDIYELQPENNVNKTNIEKARQNNEQLQKDVDETKIALMKPNKRLKVLKLILRSFKGRVHKTMKR